jgi:uncharacterized protein
MLAKNIFLPAALVFFVCFLSIKFCIAQTKTLLPQAVQANDSIDEAYTHEIDNWHEQRVKNLKTEHGWLSLIARDWLEDGKNEIPTLGSIKNENGKIHVQMLPDLNATIEGKPFTFGIIRTDADSLGPDKVVFGSKAFVVIKRGERYAIRMWDSSAETRKKFKGIERYPVSLVWRIEARWEKYAKPKIIKLASVIPNIVNEAVVPGAAIFSIDGKECRLEPVAEEGTDELFFIFADKTNGSETYGGGRFLFSESPKGKKIILDFNKAYNPPCAFTPYATCPLPPAGNRLKVFIKSGERKFGDH